MTPLERLQNPALLLFVILGVGLILRLLGNDFGLPDLFHPDEKFEVNRALQLGAGSYDFTRSGKGGYFYLLFIEFGFLFAFAYLLGFVSSAQDFAIWFISDPTAFYLLGRSTTAVLGVVTLWLLFLLVRRLSDTRIALASALLLALNPLHIEHSHYITVDVPLTLFVVLSFYAFTFINRQSGYKPYVWSAIAVACAAINKLPGLLLVLPFFLAHMAAVVSAREPFIRGMFDPKILLGGVVFLVTFLVGNPAAVAQWDSYLRFIFSIFSIASAEAAEPALAAAEAVVQQSQPSQFMYYLAKLTEAVTLPLLLLSAVGAVLLLIKRQFHWLNMAVFSLFFFSILVLSGSELVYGRYLLPIMPFLMAFAALALCSLTRQAVNALNWTTPAGMALFSGLAAFFLAAPLAAALYQNKLFMLPDTRSLAAEWFESEISTSSRIWLEGATARTSVFTVPLWPNEAVLTAGINQFVADGEAGKAKYFRLDRDYVERQRYPLVYYSGGEAPIFDERFKRSIDYLILRPSALQLGFMDDSLESFVQAVKEDPDVHRVKLFEPIEGQSVGPVIEVYQVKRPAEEN